MTNTQENVTSEQSTEPDQMTNEQSLEEKGVRDEQSTVQEEIENEESTEEEKKAKKKKKKPKKKLSRERRRLNRWRNARFVESQNLELDKKEHEMYVLYHRKLQIDLKRESQRGVQLTSHTNMGEDRGRIPSIAPLFMTGQFLNAHAPVQTRSIPFKGFTQKQAKSNDLDSAVIQERTKYEIQKARKVELDLEKHERGISKRINDFSNDFLKLQIGHQAE
eukprot:scaffold23082_cov55-Attheya_sp.AAC.5